MKKLTPYIRISAHEGYIALVTVSIVGLVMVLVMALGSKRSLFTTQKHLESAASLQERYQLESCVEELLVRYLDDGIILASVDMPGFACKAENQVYDTALVSFDVSLDGVDSTSLAVGFDPNQPMRIVTWQTY